MVVGIDVGGSTTKIVGIEDGEVRSPQFIACTAGQRPRRMNSWRMPSERNTAAGWTG